MHTRWAQSACVDDGSADTILTGVAKTLVASVQRYAVDTPQLNEQGQLAYLRRARHAKTPEYFSEFRERPDITSFLGACVYAKVRQGCRNKLSKRLCLTISRQLGFTESQGGEWMTKQAYNVSCVSDSEPSSCRACHLPGPRVASGKDAFSGIRMTTRVRGQELKCCAILICRSKGLLSRERWQCKGAKQTEQSGSIRENYVRKPSESARTAKHTQARTETPRSCF